MNCTGCALQTLSRRKMLSYGNSRNPTLAFILPSPTYDELSHQTPFSSGAGRIIKGLIGKADLPWEDIYLTYLVKCVTPKEGSPTQDIMEMCLPNLLAELKEVNPQCVVVFGDPLTTLFLGVSVDTYRGSITHSPVTNLRTLVLYEPFFYMKNQSFGSVAVADLKKAYTRAWELERPQNYHVNPPVQLLLAYLEETRTNNSLLAIDIETRGGDDEANGLNPFSPDYYIIGISLSNKPWSAIHYNGPALEHIWEALREFLSTYPNQAYQNNKFDRIGLLLKKGIRTHCAWDTMTAMYILQSSLPKKLDFLRSLYTTIPPYKQVFKTSGKYTPGALSSDKLAKLNCLDTDVTYQVAVAQMKYLPKKLMDHMMWENELAMDMRIRGVQVDPLTLIKHHARLEPIITSTEARVWEQHKISITSPKQLSDLLYKKLKLPYSHKHTTPKGTPSADEEALKATATMLHLEYTQENGLDVFLGDHPLKDLLQDILRHRGAAKELSTYIKPCFNNRDAEGRIHPDWKHDSADTTRWACKEPNMQAFPKHLRDIVVAKPGHKLMGADYTGIEVRVAGYLSGDTKLMDVLDLEGSIHPYVVKAIDEVYPLTKTYGKDGAKRRAKGIVFGTFYGEGVGSQAEKFGVTKATVELWRKIFFDKFPSLKHYFESYLPNFWRTHGYVENLFGFKKYPLKITEAINFPVQSTAGQITLEAMRQLNSLGYNIILNIHDQIVCEEPDDELFEARYIQLQDIMVNAYPTLGTFPVEPGCGHTWKEV